MGKTQVMNVNQTQNLGSKILIYLTSLLVISCITNTNPTKEKIEKTNKLINFPKPCKNWTKGNCPCKDSQLYLMESKKNTAWFKLSGENIVNLSNEIKSMSDISEKINSKTESLKQMFVLFSLT